MSDRLHVATAAPWAALVAVAGFVDPEILVESEAEAYVPE